MKLTRINLFAVVLSALAFLGGMGFGGAHAGVLLDYGENKQVDNLVRGQANALPATWYFALGTNTCSDSGSPTEPAGGAYARPSVAASLANFAGTQSAGSTVASSGTGGTTSNNAVITWAESTAAWGNLQSVWWMDASSGGNAWICIDLTAAFNVSAAGVTVRFPAAALQFQIDN